MKKSSLKEKLFHYKIILFILEVYREKHEEKYIKPYKIFLRQES